MRLNPDHIGQIALAVAFAALHCWTAARITDRAEEIAREASLPAALKAQLAEIAAYPKRDHAGAIVAAWQAVMA